MDNANIVHSTCAYCGVGCGVELTRSSLTSADDETSLSLSGMKSHPANYGQLCIKGTNLLATTSLEGRLLYPEIRGQRMPWDSAISQVAQRFNAIIAEYGPDAVAFYVSGQLLTEDYYVANKLMKGYIGSANIDTNSRLCMSSAVAAYKRAFGEDVVPGCYEDLEVTDLLIFAGSNSAWTHPVLFQRIERAKAINPEMKIIALDPRKTATTQLADIHLGLAPGSDAAFFNGLLRFMNEHNAIDQAYIQAHTRDFSTTLESIKSWTTERVAAFCRVDVQALLHAYQLFCQSPAAVTMYSMGINQSATGVDKCQAIINCHLATGKIGQPGCGPFSITGQPNAMGGREVGGLANQLAAHMDLENAEHRQQVQTFWQSPTIASQEGYKAVDMFDAILAGKIKAVWIMATNPLVSLPDKNKVERALAACELVVVSDCVNNNDTLAYADIKLPAAPWLEKDGTVTNSERCISRQRSAVKPAGEAMPDWQIVSNVAQAMGFEGFDYQDVHDIFNEHVALSALNHESVRQFDLSGLGELSKSAYDRLRPIQWPINEHSPDGRKRLYQHGQFSTSCGRASFIPVLPQLPILKQQHNFPFVLNSGRVRDQWHTMTRTGKATVLTEHSPFPLLDLNSLDAKSLNITNNELVKLHNPLGEAIVGTRINDDVAVGQLFLPIHWSDHNTTAAAINRLYQGITDPISGQAQTKQTAVQLSKVRFAQYGQLHSRSAVKCGADFGQQATTSFGTTTEFANYQAIKDPIDWCQQMLGVEGEWSYRQCGNVISLCCWQDSRLEAFASLSDTRQPINWAWLTYAFEQQTLEVSLLAALLSGRVDDNFTQGKLICSCFDVWENIINNEIIAGVNSVEQLGKQLRCGTNCGSCKPELKQLIEQHALA
ncbi:nitrate reductase [Thalassotalea fusca]